MVKKHKISQLVVGKNDGWKQEVKQRKNNKQNFMYIPFESLINKLKYKCELVGITFVLTEESYTSKSSFFDNDPLPVYGDNVSFKFSGTRKNRGLYVGKNMVINADVNGSLNIGRKVFPEFSEKKIGDRSLVARPLKVNPLLTNFL